VVDERGPPLLVLGPLVHDGGVDDVDASLQRTDAQLVCVHRERQRGVGGDRADHFPARDEDVCAGQVPVEYYGHWWFLSLWP
jgi:hypothetical protein